MSGHHYIDYFRGTINYTSQKSKNSYLDCGIFGGKASVILKATNKSFLDKCRKIKIIDNVLTVPESINLEKKNISKAFSNKDFEFVQATFECSRIKDISSYYDCYDKDFNNSLNNIVIDSKNIKIINQAQDHLIVVNGLKDILVANTSDAVYIGKSSEENSVKDLIKKHNKLHERYFNEQPIYYSPWGKSEILSNSENYKVSKITVYPNASFESEAEKDFTAHYFVVFGNARVKLGLKKKDYKTNGNFTIPKNTKYSLTNLSKKDLILIKTENCVNTFDLSVEENNPESSLVKLAPYLIEKIWGGNKIRDVLKKDCGDIEKVGESWELSAHEDGEATIASGKFKGYKFSQYIDAIGKNNLGWKAQVYERFPIMIKYIDARDDLSIQVHPNDEYAFDKEKEYGKNEMWYVMEADENACIYVGFNKDVTPAEIEERIKKKTLVEIMNKIPVKAGETYFLKVGTIHAIGKGCFVCEIQQSSNVTYRLYDYGRLDKNGKERELHLEKALDVAALSKTEVENFTDYSEMKYTGYSKQLLGQCKYFTVTKYKINSSLTLSASETSFKAIVAIGGKGKIESNNKAYDMSLGEVWFCGCHETINISGNLTVLVVNL